MKIVFVGGGNMAAAMIGGLLARGESASDIGVIELNETTRQSLVDKFGVRVFAELSTESTRTQAIVLAVKPQQLREVAMALGAYLDSQLLISIAAGVRLKSLSDWANTYSKVVRAMPNTPALVRSGVTGLYAGSDVDEGSRRLTENIMSAIGSWFWVPVETMMDPVTAVSGSGPAYVFYFLEALEKGALEFGFDPVAARQMALDTVLGAARLAAEGGEPFSLLRQRVTSKGGTTEAALGAMVTAGVAQGIVSGMRAADARSRQLGDELDKGQ